MTVGGARRAQEFDSDGQPVWSANATRGHTLWLTLAGSALLVRAIAADDVDLVALASTTAVILAGVAAGIIGIAWVLSTPIRSRARVLAAEYPHAESAFVGEFSRGVHPYRLTPLRRPNWLYDTQPMSLVALPTEIELWAGGSIPRLFAMIPRSELQSFRVVRMRVNARRAWVVEAAVAAGEMLRFVPVGRFGQPRTRRTIDALARRLEAWRVVGPESSDSGDPAGHRR